MSERDPLNRGGADGARLCVRGVGRRLPDGRRVLDGVSFDVRAGEVLALVGESGSGKSTLGRIVAGLLPPSAGEVRVDGRPIGRAGTRVQMVFQDPFASLNPVHTVEHHLARPLARAGVPARTRRAEAARLLTAVGLEPALAARHPHALSGGQRQRVAIARALAPAPEVVVADEPTSMLDVSTRLDVLTLLRRLADERRLAILLITHDLGAAAAVADRVLTLYAGRIVESGPTAAVLRAPAHPYTRLLVAAAPRGERLCPAADPPGASSAAADSSVPAPGDGCAFAPRCPRALPRCHAAPPPVRAIAADHQVRCQLYAEGAFEHAALS